MLGGGSNAMDGMRRRRAISHQGAHPSETAVDGSDHSAFACHLELNEEVGADEGTGRIVEEAPQGRSRDRERQVPERSPRRFRKGDVEDVALDDGHVPMAREPFRQARGERRIELDRREPSRGFSERHGQPAAARAELDDVVRA